MELDGEAGRRLSRDDQFSKGCAVGSEPNGELIVGDLSSGKSEGGVSFRGCETRVTNFCQ